MLTGGPTLGTDFSEYFGNIYPSSLTNCAVFHNTWDVPLTIESISVGPAPVQALPDCGRQEGDEPGFGPCTTGLVLQPGLSDAGCRFGVHLPPGTDLTQNYLADNRWVLTTVCTSGGTNPSAELCADPAVTRSSPSPSNPVPVRMEYVYEIRYCGGTDYANGPGEPPGAGGPPHNGCV